MWRDGDRLLEQLAANPAPPKFFIHVEADLRAADVGWSPSELVKIEPAGDLSADFCDPKRKPVRLMPAQPRQPFLYRNWFEQRGGDARGRGRVVDLDDRRKISFHG